MKIFSSYCLIYSWYNHDLSGVNGFLDKVPVNRVTEWESAYVQFLKTNHKDTLEKIKTEGQLDADLDAKLKQLSGEFIASFL